VVCTAVRAFVLRFLRSTVLALAAVLVTATAAAAFLPFGAGLAHAQDRPASGLGDPESLAPPPPPPSVPADPEGAPLPPPPPPPDRSPSAPDDGVTDHFGTFPEQDALGLEGPASDRESRRRRRGALLDAETRGLQIPNHVATRLRILDRDLTSIAARSGGAVVDGVLSIVAGAVSISLGVVFRNEPLAQFLYLVGGAAVARGVLGITLLPDAEEPAIRFGHMPMTSVREVRARLAYGESALEYLAERARLARLLDGGLNLAVGVAIIPTWLGPNDFTLSGIEDYFVLIAAGISILSGVISLLSETDAERRWGAYRDLRDRLAAERRRNGRDDGPWDDPLDEAGPGEPRIGVRIPESPAPLGEPATGAFRPQVGGGPVPGGAVLGLGWRF